MSRIGQGISNTVRNVETLGRELALSVQLTCMPATELQIMGCLHPIENVRTHIGSRHISGIPAVHPEFGSHVIINTGEQLLESVTQVIADTSSGIASRTASALQLGKQLGSVLAEAKPGFIQLPGSSKDIPASDSHLGSESLEHQQASSSVGILQPHIETQEAIKIFEEKYGHYKQRIKIIAETGESVRVPYPKDWMKWDEWANDAYNAIRARSDDIVKIAQNTGMPELKIARIKQHLFYDDSHILSVEQRIGRFAADHEIAAAWDRLIKGDFIGNDIQLLQHEYFESRFEKLFKTDYDTAHRATQHDTKGRPWFKPEYKE